MDKNDLVLACMAPAGREALQPVQMQKLIFIFQERNHEAIGGRPFTFVPYDYGPFDPGVYQSLEELAGAGLVEIVGEPFSKNRAYRLTETGSVQAKTLLETLQTDAKDYLCRLVPWIRSVTFQQLVGAVYNAYPAMQQNSIFRG